jgi:hypothetical protein
MSSSLKNDLIFYKEGGKIKSAGYTVDSILLQKGGSIMTTYNAYTTDKQTGGDNISNDFKDLAVPAGLSYISQKKTTSDIFSGGSLKNKPTDHHEMLADDIYDKLFGLVEYDNKQKRKTRKQNLTINKKHKKTKKM